jgi:hypothetical protein
MKIFNIWIFCMLAGASLVSSQPPSGEPMPGKMPMMPPFGPQRPGAMHGSSENPAPMMMNISELKNLMTEINIDKAVSTKIIAIARTFLNSLDDRILKIQKEEITIKEELLKEKPDLQSIQNTISRKTRIFGDIEFAQIKRDLEIKSLLTQDEYDRWKSAMMQKMRQLMPRLQDKLPPNQVDKNALPTK